MRTPLFVAAMGSIGLLAVAAPPRAARADDAGTIGDPPVDAGRVQAEDPAKADPSAPTASASLDRGEVHVGDRLTLTVSAVGPADTVSSVTLPPSLVHPPLGPLGKFDVLDSSATDQDLGDGRHARRFVVQIAAYETGELELPAIAVGYQSADGRRREVATKPIPVAVKTLVEGDKAELQPLRPTREVRVEDRRLVKGLQIAAAVVGGLLLLAAAFVALRRRRRAPVEEVALPSVPPDQLALERLAAVRARGHFAAGEYQPFYFEVSEILRAYLGGRFAFDALEKTTTELTEELAARHAAPSASAPELNARIVRLLEACDLVKFAKAGSDDLAASALLVEAEAIVRTLGAPPPEGAVAITPPPPSTGAAGSAGSSGEAAPPAGSTGDSAHG